MKTRHLILTLFAIYVFPVISVTFAEEIESDSIDESTLCGENAVLVDGVCHIIITESSHYVNTSPFYLG